MGDSPISLSSLFRNHLEVKCHKHNFGQSGCFCKGQSDLSLLCLCCPMGVAQWKWLPWRIKLVLMEKCVGFRPQHSQHESNTIRHSRLGSGWDFELVFDCTVRPMNPRSKSCHLKFRSRWRLTTQYTNIYIYIYVAGHITSNMLSRKMFLTFPSPQICSQSTFRFYLPWEWEIQTYCVVGMALSRWNAVQAMSDPKELDEILPGETKRQREALRRKLQGGGPSQKTYLFISVAFKQNIVGPVHMEDSSIHGYRQITQPLFATQGSSRAWWKSLQRPKPVQKSDILRVWAARDMRS